MSPVVGTRGCGLGKGRAHAPGNDGGTFPLTLPLPLPSANPPFTDFTSLVTGSTHEMDFAPWPLDFGLSPRPINLMGRTFKIPRVYAVPVGLTGPRRHAPVDC